MLNLLHIENIAVIEQADILFDRGLNVLTGETGAGKSIVIDAISAILGERTFRDLIRTGCDRASVSAVFSKIAQQPWFETHKIPYNPDELLIRRDIYADGRNLCRVNDTPVTVSVLKELGRLLIQIHGQHDTQTLFDEQTHLRYLDLFANDHDALTQHEALYSIYDQACADFNRLSTDESERLRRIEMLRYQLEEIDRAELREGEEDRLSERRTILQNAERLSDGLTGAVSALYGSDNSAGAIDLLSGAEDEIARLGRISDRYSEIEQAIHAIREQVQELSTQLRDEADDLAYSGDELEQIESRLDIIQRLEKKYGATEADILLYAENARKELEDIEDYDARLEAAQKRMDAAKADAVKSAESLSTLRKSAAKALAQRMESELAQLDMPSFRFEVAFEEKPLSADGTDAVRFMMTANVGESLKPMSKAASGGELARIMLAMKNVLAELDEIPILIFDEVDSGVSGRAAQKVAAKLKSVSRGKQVLCVTHLPQIAAAADAHLLIQKEAKNGRTFTSVLQLDRQGRIEELARIIGGEIITDNTRKSAEDMLCT